MTFPTLSTAPFEHMALDYARLRAEGIRLLGRLSGVQWTDFNTHDPGITILEQLCYAITDLAYRTAAPIPQLFAGTEPLPDAGAILPCAPVTNSDLRSVALDEAGVRSAWVGTEERADLTFYYRAGENRLHLRPDAGEVDAKPVRLLGVSAVSAQTSDLAVGDEALHAVARRLHRERMLGQDLLVQVRGAFAVWMRLAIEIAAVEDPLTALADIIERIENHLSPPAEFQSFVEGRARGRASEELLDGPLLSHGSLARQPDPPGVIYASDIIHAVLDVPAARAVRSLELATSSSSPRVPWALSVPAGQAAFLARDSDLRLFRAGVEIRVELNEVWRRVDARRAAVAQNSSADQASGAAAEPGVPMVTSHVSIRHQLPAVYGVGALGLPASATPERRAQAYQLEAYLLVFDQLLANAFAQLEGARSLLSPRPDAARTYFAAPVVDPDLSFDHLLRQSPDDHRRWLDTQVEPQDPSERRKRFSAHLLARFAEQLGDHAQVAADPSSEDSSDALVDERQQFLTDYPRLSAARGSGYDILDATDQAGRGGFEERLAYKLGLHAQPDAFFVVEHVLLRPIAEDAAQLGEEGEPEVPLLDDPLGPDPWSLQITFVFNGPTDPATDAAAQYAQFVAQTLVAETPAHLTPRLIWLQDDDQHADWSAFVAAWRAFRALYHDYRNYLLDGRLPAQPSSASEVDAKTLLLLRVRDARDRMIDLLELGRTYPVRDLPVKERLVISPGAVARIPVAFSQSDVFYELRDRITGAQVMLDGQAISVQGTGEAIEIPAPPVKDDISYRILAVKRDGATIPELRREAWLRTTVHLEENVDPSLTVQIRTLPLLDTKVDQPQPFHTRIGDYGVRVEVEVLDCQEGVVYELVQHAPDLSDFTKQRVISEAPVTGTSGTIVLRTLPMTEDLSIRVRGSKAVGNPPQTRRAVLDLVLPLAVRASEALDVVLVASLVSYKQRALLRINGTQASAAYRVWQRSVLHGEFVYGADTVLSDPGPTPFPPVALKALAPKPAALAQAVDGKLASPTTPPIIPRPVPLPNDASIVSVTLDDHTVRVRRPKHVHPWQDRPDFAALGAALPGNGGTLEVPVDNLEADTLFVVQALKQHTGDHPGETIPSTVELDAAQLLLVAPNAGQPLALSVALANGKTRGPVTFHGGQAGVFYQLGFPGSGTVGLPAFFHKRDELDARFNMGVEQLRIEGDFVLSRGSSGPRSTEAAALDPSVDVAPLPVGTVLSVSARKATDGLVVSLERQAVVAAAPAFSLVPATIPAGTSAKVQIAKSEASDSYTLLQDGVALDVPRAGNGGVLELATGVIQATTTLVLSIVTNDASKLKLERLVDITFGVELKVDPGPDTGIVIDHPGPGPEVM